MRLHRAAAVGAGVAGAGLAHALDVAGLLPGVHEAAAVRTAMGPTLTATWLALAAAAGSLAVRFGPVRLGLPASVLVSGLPELVGRHDPGAIAEPGALAGAALQWLLIFAVVAAVVIVGREWFVRRAVGFPPIFWPRPSEAPAGRRPWLMATRGRPRAPPPGFLSSHVI